jgi:hypothetical protein
MIVGQVGTGVWFVKVGWKSGEVGVVWNGGREGELDPGQHGHGFEDVGVYQV